MIAQRFRPLGWVAGIAAAACALYLISLQVASERGRLEEIDRKIAMTKRDIRQLQTELGTRASLRQLERWNGEVLSLSAPSVGQYLPNEEALATLNPSTLGEMPAASPPAMMAVATPVVVQVAITSQTAAPAIRPAKKVEEPQSRIRPESPRPARIAMLDRSTIVDLSRAASSERKERGQPRP
jgi:hypothetical protein